MIKKIFMFLALCMTALVFSGCGGKDYSGTYIGEPFNGREEETWVMNVKQNNKSGYDIEISNAYYELRDKSLKWNDPAYKTEAGKGNKYLMVVTATYNYRPIYKFIASEPNKQNIMTDVTHQGFGRPGQILIDKDDNLVDVHGLLSGGVGRSRVFKKVKDFNEDMIKPDLKERVEAYCQKNYNSSYRKLYKLNFVDTEK